jgi:hypothetical protein
MSTIDRRSFVGGGCAGGLVLIGAPAAAQNAAKPAAEDLTQQGDPEQIRSLLKFVDRSGDERLRKTVFERLGYECLYSRNRVPFARKFRGNIEGLVTWVNGGGSRYWEKAEYDQAAGTLAITSKRFDHCVCAWGQGDQPPKSLCTHCCRTFQTEMFSIMFDRRVNVEVTESLLLGGERCRTLIHVPPAERPGLSHVGGRRQEVPYRQVDQGCFRFNGRTIAPPSVFTAVVTNRRIATQMSGMIPNPKNTGV